MQLLQQDQCESVNRSVRVLHLEDSQTDRELIEGLLKKAGIRCETTTAETKTEFVNSLRKETWDLILADHSLLGFDGQAIAYALLQPGANEFHQDNSLLDIPHHCKTSK